MEKYQELLDKWGDAKIQLDAVRNFMNNGGAYKMTCTVDAGIEVQSVIRRIMEPAGNQKILTNIIAVLEQAEREAAEKFREAVTADYVAAGVEGGAK